MVAGGEPQILRGACCTWSTLYVNLIASRLQISSSLMQCEDFDAAKAKTFARQAASASQTQTMLSVTRQASPLLALDGRSVAGIRSSATGSLVARESAGGASRLFWSNKARKGMGKAVEEPEGEGENEGEEEDEEEAVVLAAPRRAAPCHAMPCHVMQCYVMLCYVKTCMTRHRHARRCYIPPSHGSPARAGRHPACGSADRSRQHSSRGRARYRLVFHRMMP
jgi:hypothetical protein